MTFSRPALLALFCATLVACSSSDDGSNVTGGQPDWNRYEENAQTANTIAGQMSTATRVDTTPTQDTASMSGTFSVSSDAVLAATTNRTDTIVGEMTMEADFGEGTVSGRLYNTFVDYGSAHDPLSGSLAYNGTVEIDAGATDTTSANGVTPDFTDIDANGSQTFTAADGSSYNIFVDLFGDVHEIPNNPVVPGDPITAVNGLLEGNVTITDSDGITDPLVYDLDGTYIVHENE